MAASMLGLILCCCVRRDKGAASRHHRPVLVLVIGDENAGRAPANPPRDGAAHAEASSYSTSWNSRKRTDTSGCSFAPAGRATRPGLERERLIRRTREAKTASHINEWLSSRVANRTKLSSERSVCARERFACNL
jgi:hypothetical protein